MKLLTKQFLFLLVILLGIGWATAWSGPVAKVEVCHIPPGNPENVHTIRVGEPAVAAHLAHGDLVGACNDLCATLCDDGDACTVDDTGDCEENGCPTGDRAPTDCSDGDLCTNDSCDPTTGCANDPVECNDGDLCTVDMCDPTDGQCVAPPVDCDDGFTCNPTNGECEEDAGPDPECAGQTCSTFTTCNAGQCGGRGVCGSTAEGGGLCVDGSTACAGLARCFGGTGDCPGAGDICFVNSCCGDPVCVPANRFCSDPDAPVQDSGVPYAKGDADSFGG